MRRSSSERRHYRRREIATDERYYGSTSHRNSNKKSSHYHDFYRSRSNGSKRRRSSHRDSRGNSINEDVANIGSSSKHRSKHHGSPTRPRSPVYKVAHRSRDDYSDASSQSQEALSNSNSPRIRSRKVPSLSRDKKEKRSHSKPTDIRTINRKDSPVTSRRGYNRDSPVRRKRSLSLNRNNQSNGFGLRRTDSDIISIRSRVRSPSTVSRHTRRSVEKSNSPTTVKCSSRRVWKFDSPPREDGLEEGPQQQSPMGILAQSLGLSAEQQKASRELYIGNLPPALDVNQLIDFFNAAMLTLKASSIPGNPVSRAWIASDGHFAFVEFRTIEEATIGLQLNGLNCMGYALRIGRPKTYPSEFSTLLGCTNIETVGSLSLLGVNASSAAPHLATTTSSAMLVAQAAAASIGLCKRSTEPRPDRLVILNIECKIVSEEEVKTLLSSFGSLNTFEYFDVPETDTLPATGVCVFEYKEYASQKCMMEGIKDVICGTKPLNYMLADDAIRDGKLSEVIKQAAEAGRDLQQELGGELMRPQVPTRVIMLTNIVTRDELIDDKEYADIVEDIFIECSHYGKVISVEVPRPSYVDPLNNTSHIVEDTDIGYAFVKFARLQGAGSARRSLSGRKFAGRTVEAHYFSEVLFKKKNFKCPQPNYEASERLLDSPTADEANNDVTMVPEKKQP
ncbi:splicing factor U2AF 65 kDa subunit-like [Hylaeus volcanicus]|uniref:splicing factor U2AF 65 kDa subunit-like n=1 Tax=Hylaeus volcanicus TaxID=313075 RepID=UPI0023B86067|nr:splicing factor U2AF 65 kDa subunit-like [Hylaeus volcanicus]XP_053991434.1 splicing factor U2AF 65 kDa subunit-like [Hylaeus volcanicus]